MKRALRVVCNVDIHGYRSFRLRSCAFQGLKTVLSVLKPKNLNPFSLLVKSPLQAFVASLPLLVRRLCD